MDIVDELEKGCGCYADGSTAADFESHHCVRCRAAAELTRLRSDNERMREALERFRNSLQPNGSGQRTVTINADELRAALNIARFVDAASARFDHVLGKSVNLTSGMGKHFLLNHAGMKEAYETAKAVCPIAADAIAVLIWDASHQMMALQFLEKDFRAKDEGK